MTIEIRQLVIRAVVAETAPAPAPAPGTAGASRRHGPSAISDPAQLRQAIATACAREVERQLRRVRAR